MTQFAVIYVGSSRKLQKVTTHRFVRKIVEPGPGYSVSISHSFTYLYTGVWSCRKLQKVTTHRLVRKMVKPGPGYRVPKPHSFTYLQTGTRVPEPYGPCYYQSSLFIILLLLPCEYFILFGSIQFEVYCDLMACFCALRFLMAQNKVIAGPSRLGIPFLRVSRYKFISLAKLYCTSFLLFLLRGLATTLV